MKNIIIIFTGGTISMKESETTHAAIPVMSGNDILKLTPGIDKIANIDFLNFGMFPGPHMTPEKMFELSNIIKDKVTLGGYDGVVITHGTDSLEETAYLVDLTYKQSNPVVFVGSMKNSSEFGWDGPRNLMDAVNTATADESYNRGVMVVMNNEIHAASQVTKTNTHTLDTFKSVDFGPIGFVDNNKVYFYYNYTKRQYIKTKHASSIVDIIKCGCGMNNRLINFCVSSGTNGLIIEGMGRGNVPPKMVSGIENALNKNIPVVLVSRCIKGKVLDDYGYEGAGRELREKGVILGDNLNSHKARIKLIIALGYTNRIHEIKDIFEKNYY
ncbi:asparaginase [Clostridium rectalis]|uniref:asparaginase n=1 Tax=Clostridium rectalis TaxID=2040295 RepID=UPI000F63EA77|nr:asparaginase [Clostridium rectalis]